MDRHDHTKDVEKIYVFDLHKGSKISHIDHGEIYRTFQSGMYTQHPLENELDGMDSNKISRTRPVVEAMEVTEYYVLTYLY